MRVGEKETSEQAAIVARYADLFTREQLDALRAAEAGRDGAEARVDRAAAPHVPGGDRHRELAEREDALENALLAARVAVGRRGAAAPLGPGAARRRARLRASATRSARAVLAVSAGFNDERRALLADRNELETEVTGDRRPGRAQRGRRRAFALRPILDAVDTRPGREHAGVHARSASAGSTACWGRSARRRPRARTWHGSGASRRSSRPTRRSGACRSASRRCVRSGSTSTAEQGIRPDLEDRPQKSPRACVIASDPPRVVHLITRAQGGLHDYEAFLHEAGHALHYAGCDPALPLAFRRLSRDHALTEIYSFLLDSISQRARLARRALRPLGRRGARERRRGALLEHAALPPLLGEARVRDRLLDALPDRRRHARRIRGAADGGDGHPLPGGEPPRRHGRRLLLGRLPPRLDPLRPAARVPPPRGRRRTGGGDRRPERSCATSSARARARRRRRSRSGSASTRSTPRRSSPS